MSLSSGSKPESRILCLPYDVRFQIYQHVFPPGNQIYVQAGNGSLRVIGPVEEHFVPTGLLRTCKILAAEASGFLYNRYLFNVIGTKRECLTSYTEFLQTVSKYARHPASTQVYAFDNGPHSSTMCISISSGDNKLGILRSRRRGTPREIGDIEKEVTAAENKTVSSTTWLFAVLISAVVAAAVAVILRTCTI